ncbi:DUF305 domain-containing protein [Azospirillum lipoferum]|nr:DUF305 domain-containing protein [Azospirillum lipoferum]
MALALTTGMAASTLAGAQTAHAHSAGPAMASALDDEAPFLAENSAAMDRMMSDMAVKPTGDVDADFAAMMIPHHQGAIDMALAQLRYGKNEQLRRIAQEIIVEQQQEIAAMRMALGQPLPPSVPVPTQVSRPQISPPQISPPQVPPQASASQTPPSPMHMHMKEGQPQ